MSSVIVPGQAALWVDRCRQNIADFAVRREGMSVDEQVQFIREQYTILRVLCNVTNGDAYLQGTQLPSQVSMPVPG
jgi:hypothetical protein